MFSTQIKNHFSSPLRGSFSGPHPFLTFKQHLSNSISKTVFSSYVCWHLKLHWKWQQLELHVSLSTYEHKRWRLRLLCIRQRLSLIPPWWQSTDTLATVDHSMSVEVSAKCQLTVLLLTWITCRLTLSRLSLNIYIDHVSAFMSTDCQSRYRPIVTTGTWPADKSGLSSSFNSPVANFLLYGWIVITGQFTCNIKGPCYSAVTSVTGYGTYWQPCAHITW